MWSSWVAELLVLFDLVAMGLAQRPNIIHIVVDDLGWNYRPGSDNPESSTPNLDHLAENGLSLDRFYVFKMCSPSRSSLLSGRSPIYVNVENIVPEVANPEDTVSGFQGIPPNMTLISSLMKKGGYVTRFVGKWDVGMASMAHHPKNRGFDSWLGYWHHTTDYWQSYAEACLTQTSSEETGADQIRDLWRFNAARDGPAVSEANDPRCSQVHQTLDGGNTSCLFEEALLANEAADIVRTHTGEQPLFLVYAMHLVHAPLQVPHSFAESAAKVMETNAAGFDFERLHMVAMVNAMDSFVGQVLDAVKEEKEGGEDAGQVTWENTLVVAHSDNGGEIVFVGTKAGNNWPLRGGKFSNFEGGIRTFCVVGGGFLPSERRGAVASGLFGVQDFYATYASLAGLSSSEWSEDETAVAAGLPPPDSVNQVDFIFNGTLSDAAPPRTELVIGDTTAIVYNAAGETLVGGLIRWENGKLYKLLVGAENKGYLVDQDVVVGPYFPNRNSSDEGPLKARPQAHVRVCGREVVSSEVKKQSKLESGTCLFELTSNPSEESSQDLASSEPELFASMLQRIDQLQESVFSPDRGSADPQACTQAVSGYGGYWGPWVF